MPIPEGQKVKRTIPPQNEIVGSIPEEQRKAARRTIAEHAVDAEDAARLFLMLGLFPSQEDEGFQVPDAYRFDWCC